MTYSLGWTRPIRWAGLAAILALPLAARGAGPAKLAAGARFDLRADAAVGTIDGGRVVQGTGTIDRPNWLKGREQAAAYSVNFPISRLGWRELAVRFTPEGTGNVSVTLMGPWEQASPGVLYREEAFWDGLNVDGATLEGGGFEPPSAASAWQSGGGSIIRKAADAPALEGSHLARTWHNATLTANLAVRAGTPVTVLVHARAVTPEGFREMKRIAGHDTPAHRAALKFRRGANLGNGLEVAPSQDWGVKYTAEDIRHIKAEGFDHIRIPIGWHHYTGPAPSYTLRPEIFRKVDFFVNEAAREKLNVLINIHHFDDFTTDPKGQAARFLAIWEQVAAHYAKAPDGLAFELLNEPKDAATTEVINPIFAKAVRAIRKTNPHRTIVYGPGKWNGIEELPALMLPDDDRNLIATVHCYDPFRFTHQGASWTGNGPDSKVVGIVFPGPPRTPLEPDSSLDLSRGFRDWLHAYNTEPAGSNPCGPEVMDLAVTRIKEWSDYYGRPVYLGEFGAYTRADPASRANYYGLFRRRLEAANIGWALWDWHAGFNYWDPKANAPEPGMHDALFGGAKAGR
ncbi:Endoglucanase H precursor [Aquisphaera giovannonii]|uniref:Endoglucanase H n=1 Tax=Aquisphaera giovannonii TaxID=406548 RepID=A0A5B9VVB3_9BACT|nr:glycoside hydrolase family 5 protein [Aquisphaera giovannonii]QEH32172.1 Endoglucanase H precursor [Aquisphaera giovannonii]